MPPRRKCVVQPGMKTTPGVDPAWNVVTRGRQCRSSRLVGPKDRPAARRSGAVQVAAYPELAAHLAGFGLGSRLLADRNDAGGVAPETQRPAMPGLTAGPHALLLMIPRWAFPEDAPCAGRSPGPFRPGVTPCTVAVGRRVFGEVTCGQPGPVEHPPCRELGGALATWPPIGPAHQDLWPGEGILPPGGC